MERIRRFLLTLPKDIRQKIRREISAHPHAKDNGRGENSNDDKQHDKVNDSHTDRAEQEAHTQHQGIFKHGCCAVGKAGQQRKDVQADNGIGYGDDNENSRDYRPENMFKPQMIKDISVNAQDNSRSQKNQPDDCSLSEIFLKGMEKGSCQTGFFVFYHF